MTPKLRTCLALLTAALAPQAVLAGDAPIRLSEPVTFTETHETFGAPMPDSAPMTLNAVLAAGDAHLGHPIVVETEIVEVCQKKGCFFIARSGDATARVTFVDYSFFIPTDAGGKRVVLAGTLQRESLSEEKAAHLAEDLGRTDKDLEPLEYAIIATSVRIPRG